MAMQGPCRQSTVADTPKRVCFGDMTRAHKSGQPTMELKAFTSFTLLPKTHPPAHGIDNKGFLPTNLLYTDLIPVAKDIHQALWSQMVVAQL